MHHGHLQQLHKCYCKKVSCNLKHQFINLQICKLLNSSHKLEVERAFTNMKYRKEKYKENSSQSQKTVIGISILKGKTSVAAFKRPNTSD